MFGRSKIRKDMIPNIRPTSKSSLKYSCLMSANGDIEKAEKLYDFMIKGMEDLPLFDEPKPTVIQQIKQGAGDTFAWLNENQGTIMNWVDVIRSMFGRGGAPIPGAAPAAPIPPINQ